MVNQVKIVSILMIVQGVLTAIMGLILAAIGPIAFTLMSMEKRPPPSPKDQQALMVVGFVYAAIGIAVLIPAILTLVAGSCGLRFRARIFILVALFSNAIPVFTCYCAPTSIGIMVYGLIVMFNRDVVRAFEAVAAGEDANLVQDRFARRYYDDPYPRPDPGDFDRRY